MIEAPSNTGTTPHRKDDAANRNAEQGAVAFDRVLADLQSAQLAASAQRFADDTGLTARDESQPSARHARVAAETTEARQAEAQSNAEGPARQSTSEPTLQDVRQERAVAERREGDQNGQVAKAQTLTNQKSRQQDSQSFQVQDRAEDRKTESSVARQIDQQKTADRTAEQQNPATVRQVDKTASGSNATQIRTDNGVSTTPLAATRETAPAPSQAASSSPAQTIGKMLAERGGADSQRTATESPQATQVRSNGEASKTARPNGAGAERAPNVDSQKSGETNNTRRTEFENLVRNIRLNVGTRSSSATIRLNPPTLGAMRIDVRMVDDSLGVRVEATTQHARELLAGRVSELTAALKEHNIDVQRFEIVTPNEAGHTPDNQAGGTGAGLAGDTTGQTPTDRNAAGHAGAPNVEADGIAADVAVETTESLEVARDARLDIRV